MDSHSNGNGRARATGSQKPPPEPGFLEDATGTTIESGVAVCRVDTLRGGRVASWQWRTVPPPDRARPGASQVPRALDLVNPSYGALIDHFLPLGTRPEEFRSGEYREFGDFAEGPFRSQAVNTGGEIRIGLLRDGEIRAGKRAAEVRMAKSAAMRPGAPDISMLYRVINSSLRPLQILFAVEFNLFAPGLGPGSDASNGFYQIEGARPEDPTLRSEGVSRDITHLALANAEGEMALQLGWDREADLWRMPSPDGGPGVRLLSLWRIQLPPRDNWAMGLWIAPA